jgi:hypothetical protein
MQHYLNVQKAKDEILQCNQLTSKQIYFDGIK